MLAISRALMSNPRLILLDEPTAGLAPIMVQRILDVLKEIRRKGIGLFLVEQNFHCAKELTDEVVIMQAGRLVYSGERLTADQISDVAARHLGFAVSPSPH